MFRKQLQVSKLGLLRQLPLEVPSGSCCTLYWHASNYSLTSWYNLLNTKQQPDRRWNSKARAPCALSLYIRSFTPHTRPSMTTFALMLNLAWFTLVIVDAFVETRKSNTLFPISGAATPRSQHVVGWNWKKTSLGTFGGTVVASNILEYKTACGKSQSLLQLMFVDATCAFCAAASASSLETSEKQMLRHRLSGSQ